MSDPDPNHISEQSFRESEEKFRILFENTPIAFNLIDLSKIKLYIEKLDLDTDLETYLNTNLNEITKLYDLHIVTSYNTSYLNLFEADPNNKYRRSGTEALDEEGIQGWKYFLTKWHSGENIVEYESTVKTYSGSIKKVLHIRSVVPDQNNSRTMILGNIINITQLKLAEEALKESEQRYKGIVETQSEFIVRWLPDGTRTFVNDAYCKYYNISKEEALGTSFFPLIAEEFQKHVKHRIEKLSSENPVSRDEHEVILPDGSLGWNLWTDQAIFNKDGDVIEYQSVGIDITETKQSKVALKTMEGQYQTLFESSPLGITVIRNKIILYANSSYSKMYGYSHQDEIIGEPISRLQPPELIEMLEKRGMSRQAGGEEPTSYETEAMKKNGTVFPIHVEVTSINLADGPAIMSFIRDITEQKAGELDLIETEEKLQTVISNAPVILWALDSNGIFTLSEGNALSKLGLKPGQVVGQSVYTVYKDNQDIIESHKNALNGIPGTMMYEVGGVFFESHLKPQHDIQGDVIGMIGIAFDITNIKLAEKEIQATREQLFQAQKMEAVGRLAGGIAHDFNNMLTLITLNAEMLASQISMDDIRHSSLQNILDAVTSATNLTGELLLFSRKRNMKPKIVNVNNTLEKYLSAFGSLITKNIKQVFNFNPIVGNIYIDPNHLEQVILNLIINAVDAMPQGGTLTVETEYVPENFISFEGQYNTKQLVEITVKDTGIGMTEEVKNRMFEPFFSTKEEGKGTGFGLSVVYHIIQQSNGFIKVDSELSMGTSIYLYLPKMDPLDLQGQSEFERTSEIIDHSNQILLIDDDEKIRNIVKDILTMGGFEVLDTSNALDALRIFDENSDNIRLVISDIVMPDLHGPDLVNQILQIKPSVKVLYITGDVKKFELLSSNLEENMNILLKPFNSDFLINTLKELIDK